MSDGIPAFVVEQAGVCVVAVGLYLWLGLHAALIFLGLNLIVVAYGLSTNHI